MGGGQEPGRRGGSGAQLPRRNWPPEPSSRTRARAWVTVFSTACERSWLEVRATQRAVYCPLCDAAPETLKGTELAEAYHPNKISLQEHQGAQRVALVSQPPGSTSACLMCPECACSVTQSCLTLCNPEDCSSPDPLVHGIL